VGVKKGKKEMGWLRRALSNGLDGMLHHWEKSLNDRVARIRKKKNSKGGRILRPLVVSSVSDDAAQRHKATDRFVRSFLGQSLARQNGGVSIAVKSWRTSKNLNSFIASGVGGTEEQQRYLVNAEAVLDDKTKMDAYPEPEAFEKQREWEKGLIPGKLYRTTRRISLLPTPGAGVTKSGSVPGTKILPSPVLDEGTIVLLVSLNEVEQPCEKTGNFTSKYPGFDGDLYAVKVKCHMPAKTDLFDHFSIRNGIFGSKDFDNFYMPILKQSWIAGERVINWSFTYDELEELSADDSSK